jgi:hypothetical protein
MRTRNVVFPIVALMSASCALATSNQIPGEDPVDTETANGIVSVDAHRKPVVVFDASVKDTGVKDTGTDAKDSSTTDAKSDAKSDASDASTVPDSSPSDAASDSSVDASDASSFDAGTAWVSATTIPNQNLAGYISQFYKWQDQSNQTRSCYLTNNTALDPSSYYGGYIRQFSYTANGVPVVVSARSSVADQPGFGYTVHHINNGADSDTMSSRRAPGTFRVVFAGRHHMMHEYSWTVLRSQGNLPTVPQIDRAVNTTIRYLFSTGKNNPLWTHTVDTSPLGANALFADDRSPYGEMNFDGKESAITGLGWGDHYKFATTSSPVSLQTTTWDYTKVNTVPYSFLKTATSEMGIVQTEGYATRDAGYGWAYTEWGLTSANKVIDSGDPSSQSMPYDWNWTYQTVQYNIPTDPNSKRLSWGTNLGVVGQTTYPFYAYTGNGVGYPYHSNSSYITIGSSGETSSSISSVEASIATITSATVGVVHTSGPYGVATGAQTISYGSSGYDPVYGAFTITSAANVVRMTMNVGSKVIVNPVIRITGYIGAIPSAILVGGKTMYSDVNYFASTVSMDGSNDLWITLNSSITGSVSIGVN